MKRLVGILLFFTLQLVGEFAEPSIFSLSAQTKMNTLNIYDGLSGESTYCIYQDPSGLMWFGTTNGITSFDGYELLRYNVSDVRSQNVVLQLTSTADGRLWAATSSGLYHLDINIGIFRTFDKSLKSRVSSVAPAGNTVYAGTREGLYVAGKDGLEHYWISRNHLSKINNIEDVEVDQKGRVWVLTSNDLLLFSPKTKTFSSMGLPNKISGINGLRTITSTANSIVIGTYNDGLYIYNIGTRKADRYVDVNCRVITNLSNDGKNLYVATDGAGLKVISLKTNTITKVYDVSSSSEYPLLDNTVYSFHKTKNGVCFFGYFRRGVQYNYHVEPLFHCYRWGDFDTKDKNIRSICIDGRHKVIGTRYGLYYIDEEKNVNKFFSPEELGGSIVTNIVKYNGRYYCSTFNGGVMCIDPQTLTASRFGKSETLRTGSFGALAVSYNGWLCMAGNGGVIFYNDKTGEERVYNSSNSQMLSGYANHLFFDRQNRCWISSANGISLYDPADKTIHSSGFPEGFFNRLPETIGVKGDKDNLLFSCTDGIYRTNEDMTEFGQMDLEKTIGNEFCSQLIFDQRHHHYWLGTERGLFRMDANFTDVAKFGRQVGMDGQQFSSGAITIDGNEVLWTGTFNGLYYADLRKVDGFNMHDLKIALSEVAVDGAAPELSALSELREEHSISLTYNWTTEELSFMPIMMNYCDPAGQCFEYRIGTKAEWTVLKNREKAVISDGLSWGKNTLQVRLAGQKEITEYSIYVWPSAFFVMECFCIFAILVILVLYWRQRSLVKRQQEDMLKVKKELEETKKKYSRVSSDNGEFELLYIKISEYMQRDKPYLQTDIKLSDVAAHLNCSTVKLSQMLNVYKQTNYYDFLNQYRLEEFKQRVLEKRYAQYTLLALAEECGFKRSSFFSTFKKFEGMTPTEYVKKARTP